MWTRKTTWYLTEWRESPMRMMRNSLQSSETSSRGRWKYWDSSTLRWLNHSLFNPSKMIINRRAVSQSIIWHEERMLSPVQAVSRLSTGPSVMKCRPVLVSFTHFQDREDLLKASKFLKVSDSLIYITEAERIFGWYWLEQYSMKTSAGYQNIQVFLWRIYPGRPARLDRSWGNSSLLLGRSTLR